MILHEFQKQGRHTRLVQLTATFLDFILALAPIIILIGVLAASVIFFAKGNNWAGGILAAPPLIVAISKSLPVRK